jgi:nitroreductase
LSDTSSLYEVMRTTRATRSYAPDPVDDAVLYRVLDHARFAPSGGNRQPWRVLVLRDPEAKRRLREQYVIAYRDTPMYGTPSLDRFADHLDDVPVLLLVCVELGELSITDRLLDRPSVVGGASIYPFIQNVLLALRREGLGGVLSTVVCPREPQLRELFAIPEGWGVACVIPVGRPRQTTLELVRRPVSDFAWVESFAGDRFGGGA